MRGRDHVRIDAATGLCLGRRDMQEDAVLCDVPRGGAAGIVALADGLGGHAGGAVASRLAVSTALRELASHRDADGVLSGDVPSLLRIATEAANHAVLTHAEQAADVDGMSTTLLVAVVQRGQLFWISVGDSPLFLLRAGAVRQLNEVHSLATHLDLLVEVGEMAPEEAAAHPGRACLTSALGAEPIERIDCPALPFGLRPGDVIVAASDGLLTLAPGEIGAVAGTAGPRSSEMATRLLEAVMRAEAEGQDNVSLAVLRAEAPCIAATACGRGGLRAAFGRARTALRCPGRSASPGAPAAARSAVEIQE